MALPAHAPTDWWMFGVGVVQAIGTLAAVMVALLIQQRDRTLRRRDAHEAMLTAVTAIVVSCRDTLEDLNKRLEADRLTRGRVGYWADELESDLGMVDAIDLTGIDDERVIAEVRRVTRSMRAVVRRFAHDADKVRNNEWIDKTRYQSPLNQTRKAVKALQAMKAAL